MPHETRPPPLMKRATHPQGVVALSVRMDAGSPWFEVTRSTDERDINRLQAIYGNPLVRDIFLELASGC